MKSASFVATIHHARVEDIAAIKTVLAATWRDTYSSVLTEAAMATVAAEWHSPAALESEICRPTTYSGIAKNESREVIAMVTANVSDDVLSVARLYVLPHAQRQGVGEQLLQASILNFPQTRKVRLHVEELNPKGRSFYLKQGFRELHAQVDDVAGVKLRSITMEKVVRNAAQQTHAASRDT